MERSSSPADIDTDTFCVIDSLLRNNENPGALVTGEESEDDVLVLRSHVTDESEDELVKRLLLETKSSEFQPGNENEKVDDGMDEDRDSNALLDIPIEELEAIIAKEKETSEMVQRETEKLQTLVNQVVNIANSPKSGKTVENGNDVRSPIARPTSSLFGGLRGVFPTKRRSNAPRNRKGKFWANDKEEMTYREFVKDYYQSLNTGSRYIILACLLSFATAFCFLSWMSAQQHKQDMEKFSLKEKSFMVQQERYENFRESMIHQQYEDARECRDTLKSCHSGKETFLNEISKLRKESTARKSQLQATVEAQREEIQSLSFKLKELKVEISDLKAENNRLKLALQQSENSYGRIIVAVLELLRSQPVQYFLIAVVALASIPVIFSNGRKM